MEFRVLAGIFANNTTFLRPFPKGWINSLWLHYNNAKHDKNVKNLFLLSQNIFGLVNKLCEIGLPMEVTFHYPLWYDNEGDYQQNQTFVWKAWIPPDSHFFLIYYLKKCSLPGVLDHDQHCSLLLRRAQPRAAGNRFRCTNLFPPLSPQVNISTWQ